MKVERGNGIRGEVMSFMRRSCAQGGPGRQAGEAGSDLAGAICRARVSIAALPRSHLWSNALAVGMLKMRCKVTRASRNFTRRAERVHAAAESNDADRLGLTNVHMLPRFSTPSVS